MARPSGRAWDGWMAARHNGNGTTSPACAVVTRRLQPAHPVEEEHQQVVAECLRARIWRVRVAAACLRLRIQRVRVAAATRRLVRARRQRLQLGLEQQPRRQTAALVGVDGVLFFGFCEQVLR